MGCAGAFAAAFNARDLDALAACVASDATARVDGAPFPDEQGRETIRDTSLVYLLRDEVPLLARTVDHPDVAILLLDHDGRLDVAIRVEESDGLASSLLYYTVPHRREIMEGIAKDTGLPLAEE
ncbi:MAG: hypothetical protein ACYTGZ_16920 [Planctomycetota bacterium]|jgi:hypothetical protein